MKSVKNYFYLRCFFTFLFPSFSKKTYLCARKSRNTGAFEGGCTTIDDDGSPPEGCDLQTSIIKTLCT